MNKQQIKAKLDQTLLCEKIANEEILNFMEKLGYKRDYLFSKVVK